MANNTRYGIFAHFDPRPIQCHVQLEELQLQLQYVMRRTKMAAVCLYTRLLSDLFILMLG